MKHISTTQNGNFNIDLQQETASRINFQLTILYQSYNDFFSRYIDLF
jgi:hypothetical protein